MDTQLWYRLMLGVSVFLLGGVVGVFQQNVSGSDRDWEFVRTEGLPAGTAAHAAAALADGTVLVTGGYGTLFGRIPLATGLARLYDPQTGTWRLARGQMRYPRLFHSSLVLADGRVLLAGGVGQNGKALRIVELYDPQTEMFDLLPPMEAERRNPRMNLLPGGRILITGWTRYGEILEPSEDGPGGYAIRRTQGTMRVRHVDHAGVSLNDGSVLLITGLNRRLERYDPVTDQFTLSKNALPEVYDDQAAALLYDGRVFISGGQEVYSNRCTNRTWFYDPNTDYLAEGPELPMGKGIGGARGVSDMMVVDLFAQDPARKGRYFLLCGGEDDPGRGDEADIILDQAWLFDAFRRRVVEVGPMITAHDDFAAVYLPPQEGWVRALIIAGHGPNDSFQRNCEIFRCRARFLTTMP